MVRGIIFRLVAWYSHGRTVYVIPNLFINRQNLELMYLLVGLSVPLSAVAKYRMSEVHVEENALGEVFLIEEPVTA